MGHLVGKLLVGQQAPADEIVVRVGWRRVDRSF
jgi:hypothetical protein